MYRLTHDPIWRDRCYTVYQAMEKYARTPLGFGQVKDVEDAYRLPEDANVYMLAPKLDDLMPRFVPSLELDCSHR